MSEHLIPQLQASNAIRLLDVRIEDKERQIRELQYERQELLAHRMKKQAELEAAIRG